ncbi:MAG: transglutaminase-like domain-containing protein, partial [Ruminiclostridium sp.]|nr:transglutaminase-like domain-containing protein [Ruminiclostridium sp.]
GYIETTHAEITAKTMETAANTTTLAQTSAATTLETTETEEETEEITDPPVIEDPVTEPEPVVPDPPVVTTTTTAALPPTPSEPSPPTIYGTSADGVLVSSNAIAALDYSNTKDGYAMAKYSGSNGTVKVLVTNPTGTQQVYTIKSRSSFESIPLTAGDGTYNIKICEAVGSQFAVVLDENVSVSLSNSLAPFLRPSAYVPFSYGDSAVTKSSQLCGGTANDLEKVDRVYSWLVDNVVYDKALAASVQKDYVCDSEKVINQKTGICLDYAGTMAAMLRSQNIPTQLVVGHTSGSTSLHAWVNVYVSDVGWVYGAIYFDGTAWHRMDPTFAASSKSSDQIIQYIGDGSNYVAEKLY